MAITKENVLLNDPMIFVGNEIGRARLRGSRIKVSLLAGLHTRAGLSPEELRKMYPHLSLTQIRAALAFYEAHKDDIDAEATRSRQEAEAWARAAGESDFAKRMRAEGRLPIAPQGTARAAADV